MDHLKKTLATIAAVLVFAVVTALTFVLSSQLIQEGFLASEGSAAENFAVLTASNLHLSDAQVAALKGCSYAALLQSEENNALRAMMDNDSFASKVDYAYVMVHLRGDEVKYKVTPELQTRFDAPVGTKLDIMWLLDVTLSEEDGASVDELERYSYYIDADNAIFSGKPTYYYNQSEWGNHICGYAPLYSTEGTYIGAVGVELRTQDFDRYRLGAMGAMGLLWAVSTLTLGLLFALFYRRYHHLHYDKVYTDALTHIRNRSYYNDQFIRRTNADPLRAPYFMLLIADIDLFKRVNDTFGHDAGDAVLIEISQILLETFGRAHVVRFGGEEFVAGLWVQDEREARILLDGLFARIAGQKYTNRQIELSLSVGCALYPCKELNGWLLSGMLRAADCLLYQAKENGRKQYRITRYDPETTYSKESPARR